MNLFFPPLHRHHRIKLPPISTWHLSDWQWQQHPLIKCYFREYCTRTIIIVVGKRLKKTEVSLVPSVDSRSTRNGKLPLNKLPWKLNRRITPARHTVNARLSKHTHTLYPNIAGHWGEINFTNPRKTFANKTVYLISIPQQQQQCFLWRRKCARENLPWLINHKTFFSACPRVHFLAPPPTDWDWDWPLNKTNKWTCPVDVPPGSVKHMHTYQFNIHPIRPELLLAYHYNKQWMPTLRSIIRILLPRTQTWKWTATRRSSRNKSSPLVKVRRGMCIRMVPLKVPQTRPDPTWRINGAAED